jgi:DNA-directed RNA polymerase subunit M
MEFCPKCGSILVQKTKNFGCPKCSYTTKDKIKIQTRETMEKEQKVAVVKEKDLDVLPTVEAECKKCGCKEAHFWTSQTRSGDEAETKFFKCKKCGNTWREYR